MTTRPEEQRFENLLPEDKVITTLVVHVLDESSSMGNETAKVISAYNEYLDTWREPKKNEIVKHTLVKFATEPKVLHSATLIEQVKKLGRIVAEDTEGYAPNGSTALFDAIGDAIAEVDAMKEQPDRVLLVIHTDGEENASQRYKREQIMKLMEDKKKTGVWTVAVLGSNVDAWTAQSAAVNTAAYVGASMGSTRSYSGVNATATAYADLASSTAQYRTSRLAAVDNFFEQNQNVNAVDATAGGTAPKVDMKVKQTTTTDGVTDTP